MASKTKTNEEKTVFKSIGEFRLGKKIATTGEIVIKATSLMKTYPVFRFQQDSDKFGIALIKEDYNKKTGQRESGNCTVSEFAITPNKNLQEINNKIKEEAQNWIDNNSKLLFNKETEIKWYINDDTGVFQAQIKRKLDPLPYKYYRPTHIVNPEQTKLYDQKEADSIIQRVFGVGNIKIQYFLKVYYSKKYDKNMVEVMPMLNAVVIDTYKEPTTIINIEEYTGNIANDHNLSFVQFPNLNDKTLRNKNSAKLIYNNGGFVFEANGYLSGDTIYGEKPGSFNPDKGLFWISKETYLDFFDGLKEKCVDYLTNNPELVESLDIDQDVDDEITDPKKRLQILKKRTRKKILHNFKFTKETERSILIKVRFPKDRESEEFNYDCKYDNEESTHEELLKKICVNDSSSSIRCNMQVYLKYIAVRGNGITMTPVVKSINYTEKLNTSSVLSDKISLGDMFNLDACNIDDHSEDEPKVVIKDTPDVNIDDSMFKSASIGA